MSGMRNKGFATLLLFDLLSFNLKSQYSIAAYHGSIFVDIVPDTTIQSPPGGPNKTYFIDINQDGISDLEIETIFVVAGGYVQQQTALYAQNSNTSFARDSSNASLVKEYNAGDSISGGAIFISSANLFYNYSSSMTGTHINYQWANSIGYIGVKYNNQFGWVKVVPGYASCKIEEFSLGTPLAGIKMNKANLRSIKCVPNPTSKLLNLLISGDQGKSAEIEISDILGNIVLTMDKIKNNNYEIDVAEFENGIYFVSIITDDGTATQKIIVQH
jgi:hypothetical protein